MHEGKSPKASALQGKSKNELRRRSKGERAKFYAVGKRTTEKAGEPQKKHNAEDQRPMRSINKRPGRTSAEALWDDAGWNPGGTEQRGRKVQSMYGGFAPR